MEPNPLKSALHSPHSSVVFLSGAGFSAASGIPTFRGEEGYWREGSAVYTPMEMATFRMFSNHPHRVWAWYRMRLSTCREATPNAAHEALVALEERLEGRLTLVTQNVDGLHGRSGFPQGTLMEIHGNIEKRRCSQPACHYQDKHPPFQPDEPLKKEDYSCPRCQAWLRPHVLWFDEVYSEEHYQAQSAMTATYHGKVLIVCGTSGSTNLPLQMMQMAHETGAHILDINPDKSPFSRAGDWWQCTAVEGMTRLLNLAL